MKRQFIKQVIRKAQALKAITDYKKFGKPMKSSKTYIEAFSVAYAEAEGHVHYEWSAF